MLQGSQFSPPNPGPQGAKKLDTFANDYISDLQITLPSITQETRGIKDYSYQKQNNVAKSNKN